MYIRLDSRAISANNAINNDANRTFYVVLFIAFLIISVISTSLIFYFVRYKKKSFFDAAGRKYIEILGDYDVLLEFFENILKNDEKDLLEKEIISIFFI
jgi:hypothetical protein